VETVVNGNSREFVALSGYRAEDSDAGEEKNKA
jgi:hypothetical protein